jgi:hypothetical protein
MGITSAATGSWSALWPVAFGKDITFGGALNWSGAPGSSSLAAKVRRRAALRSAWYLLFHDLTIAGYYSFPGVNHGIPQDGRVAILTVFRV